MEELKQILDSVILEFGGIQLTMGKLLILTVVFTITAILYRLTTKFLPNYFTRYEIKPKEQKTVRSSFRFIMILLVLTVVIWSLDWSFDILTSERFDFSLSIITILQALLILQIARLLDWIIGRVIVHNYDISRDKEKYIKPEVIVQQENASYANRTAQYIVYLVASIAILQKLKLDYTLIQTEAFTLNISKILLFFLILLIARLGIWFIVNIVLYNIYRGRDIEMGSQFAFNQLIKYVIYITAFVMALDSIGMNMNLILGGAAALLVGIGLGLQQIFNDLFSGIILLFERTVEIGDVLEVDGEVGKVKKIGLRTSTIEVRDNVTILLPNSKLVSDRVLNWNHFDKRVRFQIDVGVAYGSDTELVRDILANVLNTNKYALTYPEPLVLFKDFGNSALKFTAHFWSTYLMEIELVKSEMRFEIDKKFRENNITIPFPQRDVWLRKEG